MLYVAYQDIGPKTWHIGEPKDHLDRIHSVKYIQADGDELVYIMSEFINIPLPPFDERKVVQWWGDIAKFIVANL